LRSRSPRNGTISLQGFDDVQRPVHQNFLRRNLSVNCRDSWYFKLLWGHRNPGRRIDFWPAPREAYTSGPDHPSDMLLASGRFSEQVALGGEAEVAGGRWI